MKELTLQIKPVGNHCNLKCKYCYAAPFKSEKFKILDLKVLEKLIKESFELTNRIIITWHGGEPTMVGVDYFKKYIDIVNIYKKDNQQIFNMIQTNATLITDEMAKFFKDNNFIVSISLDGNKETHNMYRLLNETNGSFDKTMNGVKVLRKHNIFPPVIATVTKNNLDKGIENFDFFVKNGFKEIKYSPVYDSDNDNFSISNDEWYNIMSNKEFLKKIINSLKNNSSNKENWRGELSNWIKC